MSRIELFGKIVNDSPLFTVFAKGSILDVGFLLFEFYICLKNILKLGKKTKRYAKQTCIYMRSVFSGHGSFCLISLFWYKYFVQPKNQSLSQAPEVFNTLELTKQPSHRIVLTLTVLYKHYFVCLV